MILDQDHAKFDLRSLIKRSSKVCLVLTIIIDTISRSSPSPSLVERSCSRPYIFFVKMRTSPSPSYIRTFHCVQPWTEAESSEVKSSEAESSEAENGPKMCQLAGLVMTGILQSKVFYRLSHLTAKLMFVYFFELKFLLVF
jgi:hypothetical protein